MWPLSALASRYVHFAPIARPLENPGGVRVITVGGATLGGSGKTPLALAVTRHLASAGRRVAIVSHAYRAPDHRGACFATADERRDGDEAAECALALAELPRARVATGRVRQEAFDLAASWADLVVIDGPLQLTPKRSDLALLAVDADRPFSRLSPPLGDARAPERALVDHADVVVPIHAGPTPDATHWVLRGAREVSSGARLSLATLRGARVGLVTTSARPERVVRTLARYAITPAAHVELEDHAWARSPPAALARARVDLWLAPTKARCVARWRGDFAWLLAEVTLGAQIRQITERFAPVACPPGPP